MNRLAGLTRLRTNITSGSCITRGTGFLARVPDAVPQTTLRVGEHRRLAGA